MCGLFGIVNTKEPIKFNKSLFNILGVFNDKRGGDSCGIFIDHKVEYGVSDNKLFADFMKDSTLIPSVNSSCIAIGHCRKASVGGVSAKGAQPVVIKNEKGDIEFVLIHNGTIYNYEELAKKYIPKVDIKNLTDSQVMAFIFYNCGYEVLKEYRGGSVFVIVDYRDEQHLVKIFKGESYKSEKNKTLTEERPLYFVETNNGFVFSSVEDPLSAYFYNKTVYLVPTNSLVYYKDHDFYLIKEYDRKNCFQSDYPSKFVQYSYDENDCMGGYFTHYGKENSGYYGRSQVDYKESVGKYFLDNKIIDDKLMLSYSGIVLTYHYDFSKDEYYYFWNGLLLKNETCFNILKKLEKDSSVEKVYENFFEFVCYASVNPVLYEINKSSTFYSFDPINNRVEIAKSDYIIPFSHKKFSFANGLICNSVYNYEINFDDKFCGNEETVDFFNKIKKQNESI